MKQRFVVRVTDHYSSALAGRYVKLGGGTTDDLSEAQVIGWKRRDRWTRPVYELVPVRIELE